VGGAREGGGKVRRRHHAHIDLSRGAANTGDRADETANSAVSPLIARAVCQAWHRTEEVRVLLPGVRRAEG
jgi:hypothetical protein